jgi:hypothetical protein
MIALVMANGASMTWLHTCRPCSPNSLKAILTFTKRCGVQRISRKKELKQTRDQQCLTNLNKNWQTQRASTSVEILQQLLTVKHLNCLIKLSPMRQSTLTRSSGIACFLNSVQKPKPSSPNQPLK